MQDRYTSLGNGPEKVLVLHDFFSSTISYEPLLPYLDQETFTYVFFDLKGYGKSQQILGHYTLEEISRDCLELADFLHWEAFHLVGHSMTGLAIQHLNCLAPKRVLSATAITPVPATGSPMPQEFINYVSEGIRGNDAIIREIIQTIGQGRYNRTFIDFKLKQFRSTAKAEARIGYLNMFTQNDISEKVKGQKTAFHVIIGSKDSEWHGREVMQRTFQHYYSNCIISEITEASHFPMQETPVLLASLIEEFLCQQAAARRDQMVNVLA